MSEPILDYIEGREQDDRTERAVIAARMRSVEAALAAAGIGTESLAGRVVRLVVRVAGLGVLYRTREEIASDASIECSADSIPRAIRVAQAAGLLRRGVTVGGVTGKSAPTGLALQIDMSVVNQLADSSRHSTSAVRWSEEPDTPRGAPRGAGGGATRGATVAHPVAQEVAHPVAQNQHTVYPSYPNSQLPPPPLSNLKPHTSPLTHDLAAAVDLDLSLSLGGRVERSEERVSDAAWADIRVELVSVGVKRPDQAIQHARTNRLTPDAVHSIIDEYRTHAKRFDGPGAVVDRLRSGGWPIELPTAEATAAAARHAQSKWSEQLRRRYEAEFFAERRAKRLGPPSDAEVEAYLRKRFEG